MSAKPMHGGILRRPRFAANRKNFAREKAVVIFMRHSIFRAPNDSEHLSTCPAAARLISERGRKDRQLKNSALNEESRSNSGQNNNAESH
jgi:hypothetical protein